MLHNKTLALVLASALLVAATVPVLAAPAGESPEPAPSIIQVAFSWLTQWVSLPGMDDVESPRLESKQSAAGDPNGLDNDAGDPGPQTFTSGEEDSSPDPESGVFVPPNG